MQHYKKLKISSSILHRYEIFDICGALEKINVLEHLYCTYPKFEVKKYGISEEKINNKLMYLEILSRINDILWYRNFYFSKFDFYLIDKFDQKVSELINCDCNIFYGSGGMCLNTFNKLNSKVLKVYHSASMHISTKKKLMIEAGYNENEIINYRTEKKFLKEIQVSDYIVCTSRHTYNSFLENKISENKLILNPSAIDTKRFYYDNNYENKDDKFKFLFVGNLSIRKGGLKLLQAYKKIRNKNTCLIIVGKIDYSLISEFKKYSTFDDIIFIGKIKNSHLFKIYSSCHLLCLFSSEEGFAKVIGEGMSCGLPVLCSKNSGGDHFIKNDNHGMVLENLNLETIEEAMLYYSQKKDEIILNKNKNHEYANKNFKWQKSVDNLCKNLLKRI